MITAGFFAIKVIRRPSNFLPSLTRHICTKRTPVKLITTLINKTSPPINRHFFTSSSSLMSQSREKITNIVDDHTKEKNTPPPATLYNEYLGYKSFDPEKGGLIYVGTLTKSVKLVKGFSLTTSILAVALVPVLYTNFQLDTSGGVMAAVAMGMNFFIFLTPVMLHFLTKRYVTSMYYNPNNNIFTATTINLFLQTKTHKFSSSLISIPKPSPFTSVIIDKKTPLLVDPTLFVDKEAMMLFYKCNESVDFELGSFGEGSENSNMTEDEEKKK